MCYTVTDKFRVKRKFMDFELFKKIIDECTKHSIFSIRLSLRGEPFIPCMSVIDLLFNHGEKSLDIIKGVGVPVKDEVFF